MYEIEVSYQLVLTTMTSLPDPPKGCQDMYAKKARVLRGRYLVLIVRRPSKVEALYLPARYGPRRNPALARVLRLTEIDAILGWWTLNAIVHLQCTRQ